MTWAKDITGVEIKKPGTFRSLNGAADENIFIGRASKAGFFCFFKAWRDMPYDAVLDYEGVLYRVEVKGSSDNKFDVTRGSRSGAQIVRGAGTSRKRPLSREDCDFAVCVDSNTGDCYIVPEDIIEIINCDHLSIRVLEPFKEKWKLMVFGANGLTLEQTRDGLCNLRTRELTALVRSLGLTVPTDPITPPGMRPSARRNPTLTSNKDKSIYTIWTELAKRL